MYIVLVQQNVNANDYFAKDWSEYQVGFNEGDLINGKYWIGLDRLHSLTSTGLYLLRVDLVDASNNELYEEFDDFTVGTGTDMSGYVLSAGSGRGTAGDADMTTSNGMGFCAKNYDCSDCAIVKDGGSWFASGCNGLRVNCNNYFFMWKDSSGADIELKRSRLTLVLK